MFDLRVPESLANLPGRVVGLCWDEDDLPAVKLPAPKVCLTAEERLEIKRQKYRDYYARVRVEINKRRAAKRIANPRPKQTPEQLAERRAAYWASNRERINARRAKL